MCLSGSEHPRHRNDDDNGSSKHMACRTITRRKGRRAEAVALLEEVLRIDPAHADANKMLPLLQR